MMLIKNTLKINSILLILCTINISTQDITPIFQNCHKKSNDFDTCIKRGFNQLKKYFKTGLPEYNIAPFDPHKAAYVEIRRGDGGGLGGFRLVLTNVSEFGWSNSEVTKYRTDKQNNRIVYSQSFPEKSLDGLYDFNGRMFGNHMQTKGHWNMTLYKYSQTTSVTRLGGPGGLIKAHIEIDKIGDLKLHITDLFGGRPVMENIADFLINNIWQPGFPVLKPMINELVSTAFTDIFTESFRYFPIDKFIRD